MASAPDPATPERTTPVALGGYISGTTLASSDGPAWKDLFVQVFTRQRVQRPILVPAVAEPLIVWIMSGDVRVEEREPGGAWTESRVTAGDFFLTRSPTPYEMRWKAEDDQPFRVMQLYLSISLFERVAEGVTGASGRLALADVSGARDPTLSHLLSLVHDELVNPDNAHPLFVEGLAQSLAVHLVRRYAVSGPTKRQPPALPGLKLRCAIAAMEAGLDQPFDLKRLADAVGMSKFHFSRLFKKATGQSPSHFFIRLRIAEARRLLQETDVNVLNIALAVGYSSPSHFAQIFRRETGLAPSDYRSA
jgi:AraC family transcriptional regulator